MSLLAYLITLLSLSYLAIVNSCFIFQIKEYNERNLVIFGVTFFAAWFISRFVINGKLDVLIHEVKHYMISTLVGNKFGEFYIKDDHGHFQFKYAKDKKKYLALISLAPYYLPLFTVPGLLLVYIAHLKSPEFGIIVLGVLFGSDTSLNIEDIAPYQTDLTETYGGYYVSLWFITVAQITMITTLSFWVAGGWQLIESLGIFHFEIMKRAFEMF